MEEHPHLFIKLIIPTIMFGLERDPFVVLCILIGLSPPGDRSIAGFWSFGRFKQGMARSYSALLRWRCSGHAPKQNDHTDKT